MYIDEDTLAEYREKMHILAQRGQYNSVIEMFNMIFSTCMKDEYYIKEYSTVLCTILNGMLNSRSKEIQMNMNTYIEQADIFVTKLEKLLNNCNDIKYYLFCDISDVRFAQYFACIRIDNQTKANEYMEKSLASADMAISEQPFEVGAYFEKINKLIGFGKIDEAKELLSRAEMFVTTEQDNSYYKDAIECIEECAYYPPESF